MGLELHGMMDTDGGGTQRAELFLPHRGLGRVAARHRDVGGTYARKEEGDHRDERERNASPVIAPDPREHPSGRSFLDRTLWFPADVVGTRQTSSIVPEFARGNALHGREEVH